MKIYLLAFLLFSLSLKAQTNAGAHFAGLSHAVVALGGLSSVNANQAGLLDVERPSVSLNFSKKLVGQALTAQTASLALPYKHQVWAFGLYQYGFEAYREQEIQLIYARSFGPEFAVAMAIKYHQLNLEKYGKSATYSIEAGMQYQLNKDIRLGAHISNLSNHSFDRELQYAAMPVKIQFGAVYHCSKQVMLALAIAQSSAHPLSPQMGIEYQPATFLYLRAGCRLQTFSESAGIGLNWKAFKLDLAYSVSHDLGYGTQIGLEYAF